MKTKVQFDHVYKQYNLGLTRTSLPSIVSDWVRSKVRRAPSAQQDNKSFWALHDVSFDLQEGQSLALVGSNGAGKTTILKLLSNIMKPTSGAIRTYGKLSALIELGAGFHPDLTGRENIYLNGAILGLKRNVIASRFDEIVAFSEIERFIDTPVKRYSSGMTVRLGFAVASCIEPEILLVDEVLAVGDATFQQKCMKRIRSLINNGTSIIFVSHNFYLVQAICNSALYLEKGRVKHFGTTKDVIDLYEQDMHQARTRKLADPKQKLDATDTAEEIEITKVEIWGEDGPIHGAVPSTQPVQIRVHYNAYQAVGNVHVSVFIMRSDGLTCCMMRTKLDDFELSVERGQGVVTLQVDPLQLISGAYYAEAWFLNQSDSMVITPKGGRSDWFTVRGKGVSVVDDSGIFEPRTQWGHELPGQLVLDSKRNGHVNHHLTPDNVVVHYR